MKLRKFLIIGFFPLFLASTSFASVENANFLAGKGIIVNKSTNPSEYRLNSNILRQEAGVIALGIYGGKVENFCKGIFRDVSATKPNSWACKTIEALAKYDIISDDNLYFKPEAKITKAEALGMLVKAGLDDEYDYDDDNIYTKGNWQKQVVNFAVSRGLVKNFSDYNSLATRSFVFEVGANILKYKENGRKNFQKNLEENSIFDVNKLERYNQNTNSKNVNLKNISPDEAKNIALKNAGLKENEIYGLVIESDYDYGKLFYEVDFYKNNSGTKFEYKIDASNGQIVKSDFEKKYSQNYENYSKTTTQDTKNQKILTVDEIKKIVLKHSGLKESDVLNAIIKEDFEYGKMFFEVDFLDKNTYKKYEYKIDASNGQIVEFDVDFD